MHLRLAGPLVAAALGPLLGVCALLADLYVTGEAGTALSVLPSSGALWGVGAMAAGFLPARPVAAAVSGLAVLGLAVLTYYGGNQLFEIRNQAGWEYNSDKAAFWALAAAIAGPAAGLLGWQAVHGPVLRRSLAVGTAAGLVAAQGIVVLTAGNTWIYDNEGHPDFWIWTFFMVMPCLVALAACLRHRSELPLLVLSVVGVAVGAAWSAADSTGLLSPW